MKPEEQSSKILEIVDENHDTKRLVISKPNGFEYIAGHFLMIYIEKNGETTKRAYSLSSTPTRKNLEMIIKYVKGGLATEKIFNDFKVGDEIKFMGPYGVFLLDETKIEGKESTMFYAGGVGIAPILGMMQYIDDKKLEISKTLFFSNKFKKDLLCINQLDEIKNLNLISTLTREEGEWDGIKGRINECMIKPHLKENQMHFICGSLEFVNNLKKLLMDLGVEKENIKAENFGEYV